MKKSSSWLLTSSRLLASALEQPSLKPWRISHRPTCHPSSPSPSPSPIQSRSVTCPPSNESRSVPSPPSNESPSDTWPTWPSSPSTLSKRGTWQVLPKLMHPFNGSMFTPSLLLEKNPLALDQNSHALEKKHDPVNSLPNIGSMPIWFQKGASNFEHKDVADDHMQMREVQRLLRLTQLEALKERLKKETREVMTYSDLLDLCSSLGVASSPNGAMLLVKQLDDAGFIFIFQDIVYLKPKKIAQLLKEVLPQSFASMKEKENIVQEMSRLEQEKDEIDKRAYNHSRKVLWLGFGYLTLQMGVMFHLTFWELSWDVMEPIAYFITNITLLLGYAFFMTTSKHPTYRDLSTLLTSSKQKKIMKARNFDVARLFELQKQYGSSTTTFVRSSTTKGD